MKKIRVGIIGFGLSGSIFHAPIIRLVPGFDLVAVASSKPEKVIAKYPHLKTYFQSEALISDPTVDLIVVTAPNQQHFPLAKMALEQGKHVVVEKPFVLNVQEGEELIKLAQAKNLTLGVYHNRRWDNDFIALKQCLTENLLGEIYQCEIRFERFRPHISAEKWREQNLPGSGLLYDLGSHLIDQALCLFGWPKSIYADIASQRNAAVVDDYFHLLLGYEPLKVMLHVGSVVKKPGPRFLVHGSKGSFTKYGIDPQEKMLLAMEQKGVTNIYADLLPHSTDNNVINITYEHNGQDVTKEIQPPMGDYRQYYQQLYEAIIEQKPAPVTAQEGLDCIRLIEYAIESHFQGRTIFL